MSNQDNATNSLAHTKWNCKYHIVFAPKYRRKVFFNEKREAIREIIKTLCDWKGVEIIEGEICPDHIHLLLAIPPKLSISGFMGYLNGKSSLLIGIENSGVEDIMWTQWERTQKQSKNI